MAWTTISNALVAVGAKPFATTVQALRDNPIAIAEGSAGAPIVAAGWHPHNATEVGGGSAFYDFAIDGAVSAVEFPFDEGYEYIIFADSISGTASTSLSIEMYRDVDAAYTLMKQPSANIPAANLSTGAWFFEFPRRLKRRHRIETIHPLSSDADTADYALGTDLTHIADITLQGISKARVRWGSGNFDAGKIWLYRRREYITA
jgi:hypothetical protein